MPRAIWSGSISFGLVSIPVKLFSAVSEQSVRFNQLDGRDHARVRQKRVNESTGEEVPYDEIVKGYELSSGSWVVVTDDDHGAVDARTEPADRAGGVRRP
jgi:DNA end-binding protein Ku